MRFSLIAFVVMLPLSLLAQGNGASLEALLKDWTSGYERSQASAGRQLAWLAESDLDGTYQAVAEADPERAEDFLKLAFKRLRLDIGRPSTGIKWGRYLFFDADSLPATIPMAMKVPKNTPAAKAGMKPGDSIVAMDGMAMPGADSFLEFKTMLGRKKPGDKVVFKVTRMQLGKRPHRIWDVGKKPIEQKFTVILGPPINKPCRAPGKEEYDYWKQELLWRISAQED